MSASAFAATNNLPKNLEPFNTVGRWIVDAQGRVVIQHGLNSINKFEPHTPFIRPEDADLLAKEGLTQIRLGIKWAKVEPEPGKYDDAFIDQYINHIKMLHARGIYTALTFFQDNYSEEFAGHGAPKWAVFTDGIPNININYYANPTFNPALQRAFDNFYANRHAPDGIGIQDHYANAWAYVAKKFIGVPGVIGFDLMNEPQSGSYTQLCWLTGFTGCAPHDVRVTAFNNKMQKAIHKVDPNRLIIWEPGYHHSMGYASGATLKAPRAVYSFHQYCPTMPARQLSLPYTPPSKTLGLCQSLESYNINSHVSKGIRENTPPLMGEFGATEDVKDIGHVVDVADKHMLPWTHWAWFAKDPAGTGDSGERPWEGVIKDPTLPPSGDNLVHDKLNVLVRPYPLAVAGTPQSYGFNRTTKAFKLSYSATNPQGKIDRQAHTEVFVPARQYPNGYTAIVLGGSVTSAPNADVLLIKTNANANKVDVQVIPKIAGTASNAVSTVQTVLSGFKF
ncbi:MAG: cellulase family glycosylhydrolase [Aquabacterium sp.]|nr:cellulase family glycosylhydrolase [Aquabacterium sp.]